jgi:hypothetical protein
MLRLHHGWKGAETMSANTLAPAPPLVNTQVNILRQTAGDDPKYNFAIDYYPKRRGDTRGVFLADEVLASPAKPREVEWIVMGLQANQQSSWSRSTSLRRIGWADEVRDHQFDDRN